MLFFLKKNNIVLKNSRKKITKGFTIIELVIILAIVAIVTAIAVPAYQGFIASSQVVNDIHKLKESVDISKSEAITLGTNVILCPSNNLNTTDPTCSGTNNWNSGWIIMVPANNNCSATSGNIIKVYAAIHPDENISSTSNSNTPISSICFNRDGIPTTDNQPFYGLFNVSNINTTASNLCLNIGLMGKSSIVNAQQNPSCD